MIKYFIMVHLFCLLIFSGCTNRHIVKPQPEISTCRYCVGNWTLVCISSNTPFCAEWEWQCKQWDFLSCRDDYPAYYYKSTPNSIGVNDADSERILNALFGIEREPQELDKLAKKIGVITLKDVEDFNNNGQKPTREQLKRVADRFNASVETVNEIYENRIIVEAAK